MVLKILTFYLQIVQIVYKQETVTSNANTNRTSTFLKQKPFVEKLKLTGKGPSLLTTEVQFVYG